jgi:L,D-transpeptidase ErfK/SrfK
MRSAPRKPLATGSIGLIGLALLAATSLRAMANAPTLATDPLPERPAALARAVVGGIQTVSAVPGDSLNDSDTEACGVVGLARANGLPTDARLAIGQRLRVESVHVVPASFDALAPDAILVNVPQKMLFERREGFLVAAYPIAVGRPDWRTPLGDFEIDRKATDKPWIVPRSIQEEMRRIGEPVLEVIPPGPENPLGRHWLGLSRSSCGIHGTNAPASIYSLRTHGCIRLHPDDVASLFARAGPGDPVRIVYEPILLAALADERICLEVHPDAYARIPSALALIEALARSADLTDRIDWTRITKLVAEKDGIARDVTRGHPEEVCAGEPAELRPEEPTAPSAPQYATPDPA